jgi:hypothetical protein
MVMAALTALKSTNFDFCIIILWLFGCEELVRPVKSNRIRIKSYLPPEKSVGGQTCQFWQVYTRPKYAA